MKLGMCHYSYHRLWTEQSWDVDRLTDEVKALDIPGIDYHARLLGTQEGAAERIAAALDRTGLELSGFSLSTDFNQPPEKLEPHLEDTLKWLDVAAQLKAPACRVFGGHADRANPGDVEAGMEYIIGVLKRLAPEAESRGLVLALENHSGLPGTAEEQNRVIEEVGSPAVRSTIDVGNYMGAGQEGADAVPIAAKYAAYVHVKDCKKTSDELNAKGGMQYHACTVGAGDVDIPACLRSLAAAGYDGYVAIEYEGKEDEAIGVPASTEYMKKVLAAL
jgi:sugar phosphate isomerase/epimerase